MGYRTPAEVKDVFSAHPRRALILTTVVHESRAVQAHLKDRELLTSRKGGVYEYGRFAEHTSGLAVLRDGVDLLGRAVEHDGHDRATDTGARISRRHPLPTAVPRVPA
jgi:hypothetical protein